MDEPRGVPRIIVDQKDRANRLKALGNAIVPQNAKLIGLAIKRTRLDLSIYFKLSLDCTEQYSIAILPILERAFTFPFLFNHLEVSVNERRGVVFTKFRKSSNIINKVYLNYV